MFGHCPLSNNFTTPFVHFADRIVNYLLTSGHTHRFSWVGKNCL